MVIIWRVADINGTKSRLVPNQATTNDAEDTVLPKVEDVVSWEGRLMSHPLAESPALNDNTQKWGAWGDAYV